MISPATGNNFCGRINVHIAKLSFPWMTFTEFKTKSKSGIFTRHTPYAFLDVMVKRYFHYCLWDGLTRGSNGNTHSITMNGKVSVPGLLVPFLEFVMIHWSQWN